jgi:hypothetical protein
VVALPLLLELCTGAPASESALGELAAGTRLWAGGALFALLAHAVAPPLLLRLRAARRAALAVPGEHPPLVLARLFSADAPAGCWARWGTGDGAAARGGADEHTAGALFDALGYVAKCSPRWGERATLIRAAVASERAAAAAARRREEPRDDLTAALAAEGLGEGVWAAGIRAWREDVGGKLAALEAAEAERRRAAHMGRAPEEEGGDGKVAEPPAKLQQAVGVKMLESAGWGVSEAQARTLHVLLDDLVTSR